MKWMHFQYRTQPVRYPVSLQVRSYVDVAKLTELTDMVASSPVVGSFLNTETTQHPQPPSPHICLVPDNPYCDLIHSFNVVFGSVLDTCTLPPLRVNETFVVGERKDIDHFLSFAL